MKARLEPGALATLRAAAEKGYPHEVCGILLGSLGAEPTVSEAHPVPNINAERSRDRYLLDPAVQLKLEKEARSRGLEVVGYFHSHPDHPALASQTDNELSWESTLYLIQAVTAAGCGELKGWHRVPGQARLAEVALA